MRNAKGQFTKGEYVGFGFKKGVKVWNKDKKGIHLSPKTEFKKGMVPWNKGTKGSQKAWNKDIKGKYKKKGGFVFPKGEKNPRWRGGITPINLKIRGSLEYKLWRRAVFERDKYTCVWCGVVGGRLHADHIKAFSQFPELRFAIDNGRTLCVECHKKTDNYATKAIQKRYSSD